MDPGIGLKNTIQLWGWASFEFDWIKDRDFAIYTVVLAAVWQSSGFVMAMFLAGLRGIDNEILKAAQIDGASNFNLYCGIVIPQLGPAFLSMIKFSNFEEAVEISNNIAYGLSAGVYSNDISTCLAFARCVQAGTIWSNTWMDGFPEVAFGGMKQSGQGREIGRYGLEEFLEVKSVVMRIGRTCDPWVTPVKCERRWP